MPENVSNSDALSRIADAVALLARGAGRPLLGKAYDFATDDGVRQALADVVRTLGGEVAHA